MLLRIAANLIPQLSLLVWFGAGWLPFAVNSVAVMSYATLGMSSNLLPGYVAAGAAVIIVLVVTLASFQVTSHRRRLFAAEQGFRMALEASIAASVRADSILNHTLKNSMVECRDLLELSLPRFAGCAVCTRECDSVRTVGSMLQRGITNCQNRQAYLQLNKGVYQPCHSHVDLRGFCAKLCEGRNVEIDVPLVTPSPSLHLAPPSPPLLLAPPSPPLPLASPSAP